MSRCHASRDAASRSSRFPSTRNQKPWFYIGGSDFAPTTQQVEVYQHYRRLLGEYEARMAEIRGQDIAAFNELLRAKGIGGVMTGEGRKDLSM